MLLLAGLMKLGEKENPEKWLQIGVYGVPAGIRTRDLPLRSCSLSFPVFPCMYRIIPNIPGFKGKSGRLLNQIVSFSITDFI